MAALVLQMAQRPALSGELSDYRSERRRTDTASDGLESDAGLRERWGSRGRRFKSCQPDGVCAGQGHIPSKGCMALFAD